MASHHPCLQNLQRSESRGGSRDRTRTPVRSEIVGPTVEASRRVKTRDDEGLPSLKRKQDALKLRQTGLRKINYHGKRGG